MLCAIALIEGSLLSRFGFGWFVVAMAVTLCVAARFLPKFMRLDRGYVFVGDDVMVLKGNQSGCR